MDDAGSKTLCPTCGRAAVLCEKHHPLGSAHAPRVTIDECVVSCHPVLSERQLDGGVQLDHDSERSESESVWALFRGLSDLNTLLALNTPWLAEPAAERTESLGVSSGRMVDMLYRLRGEDGIRGPDPRANDLRRASRRGRRVTDISRPRKPAPPPNPAADGYRMKALLEAFAGALGYLPADAQMPRDEGQLRRLAASTDQLAERFHELERRGHEAEFTEALDRSAGELLDSLIVQLQQVGEAEDLLALPRKLLRVGRMADRFFRFAEASWKPTTPIDGRRCSRRT